MTLDDIDLHKPVHIGEVQSGFIRVWGGRGKKERIIPLGDKLILALRHYLEHCEKSGSNILFLNRFGGPVIDRGVQKTLKKYCQKAGIARASIHTLRHTFGFHHASKGMVIKALQEIMGHKDMRSTMVYITLSSEIKRGQGFQRPTHKA